MNNAHINMTKLCFTLHKQSKRISDNNCKSHLLTYIPHLEDKIKCCPEKSIFCVQCLHLPRGIEFPVPVIGDSLTVSVASQSLRGGSHVTFIRLFSAALPFAAQRTVLLSKDLANMKNEVTVVSFQRPSNKKQLSSPIFLPVVNIKVKTLTMVVLLSFFS